MKITRQAKILDLIQEYAIDTQEELIRRLKEDGYNVTQATISRDIKDLKIQKTLANDGKYKYVALSQKQPDIKQYFKIIFSSGVVSVDIAQNLVIIKTSGGMAQAICAALDELEFADVVGTLAGEDTVFVAMKTNASAENLLYELKGFFQ